MTEIEKPEKRICKCQSLQCVKCWTWAFCCQKWEAYFKQEIIKERKRAYNLGRTTGSKVSKRKLAKAFNDGEKYALKKGLV